MLTLGRLQRTHRGRARGVLLLLPLAIAAVWLLRVAMAALPPDQGPGGPIVVITSSSSTFGKYYAEILRTEGLNAFDVTDVSNLNAALAGHDVVVLAKMALSGAQVTALTNWVNAGGRLIAMAPDPQLAGLLGLTSVGATLSEGYLLVDTSTAAGNGIAGQTMQFHGTADRYVLDGATSIATLYSNATTATANPAVTVKTVGSGQAAAFTYDLATSIVYTRQGNPAWAAQERDGQSPIRSDDKYFGDAAGDPQPDWVDLAKVAIPQADEQQRLFANLILTMNLARKPLPRFWYFPNANKAVVVMTGDDHGNGGTAGRFDQFIAASTPGCSVANWECVRGTSYVYPGTPLSNAQAQNYTAAGFEVGLHINTSCSDFTPASLEATYVQEIGDWSAQFTGIPQPITQRHHCIVWSDWVTAAKTQLAHGMRLDVSYYFWPPGWVANAPGLFTGSAMPMRLADLDGTLIDVYEATSQMTDESGQSYPFTIDTLLDRALGAEGYYGAYTVNAHTDSVDNPVADAVVGSAKARNVPIIATAQLLKWLDARNNSTFGSMTWNGSTLAFDVTQDPAAIGLQAMLPNRVGTAAISGVTRNGGPVSFTVTSIKGIEYATFAATGGSYAATYAVDAIAPTVNATSPVSGATGVDIFASTTATFSEAIDPTTISGSTFGLRDGSNNTVAATVTYAAATRTATLDPGAALTGNTVYTATVKGGAAGVKDLSGNALPADVTWSFTTAAGPNCPCQAWPNTATPANPSVADPGAVELGVKFRSDVSGTITGIRFYKGTGNTGTHIGNLWSIGGQLLATATFANETATGWQQVTFASPVAITANTVYVASYFAPNGHYAGDNNFFAAGGVDNAPLHLLQDGASGGNGVYAYGAASSFPTSTFSATNYWVDVTFSTGGGGIDTTPPTVTATSPTSAATNVSPTASVTATFSEPIDPATVGSTTFQLRNGATLVPATVTYNAASSTATLAPSSALAASTTYTATLVGGGADPRIKDVAGNALAANFTWSFTTAPAGGVCASPPNAIVAENCLAGNPSSEWDVSGAGDLSIQGFATDISVDKSSTVPPKVTFKVSTTATNFRFDIYRMGYYGGLGARKVDTVTPTSAQITASRSQPACLAQQTTTGLIDCGNWSVSGEWTVPQTAVSGIYFARAVRADTGGASHIVFVVRDDLSTSDILFQTSDTTWQAYNNYGGNSLYTGNPVGRAYKVSYNRPFNTRAVDGGQDWVFNAEYPMVRWLESNGYDISYTTGVDSDRAGALIRNHRVFMSVGHDEYWSGGQRANVEAARNAGVNIAFFSGNEIFWKTRWENSIDGSGTPYRTLVTYKETHANARIDPADPPTATATWLDPRFGPGGSISPTADGGRPGNALAGTIFYVNDGATTAITVPEADGKMRFWRNTSIATLAANQTATLPNNTLGYEWDSDLDNGFRPAGLFRLSTTVVNNAPVLVDFGSTYGSGTATHYLTFYKHPSGARVFGAGTVQWSWGLDSNHDRGNGAADVRMQQATVNLLADMNAQPRTLQSNLVTAAASTDTVAPTSTITAPASGAALASGAPVTITGTAADTGGGVVGGVEVSVDNGATWHPANGRATWTYGWTPSGNFSTTIRSRAVDDSGNLEAPGAGIPVTVGSGSGGGGCPCSVWPVSTVPGTVTDSDSASVTLGVKFTSDVAGSITGIRFYKGATNTGTHVGSLWTVGGQLLASATFQGETASGWQQVNFATPVTIAAGTVYVASYFAPNGHYSADVNYFANAGVDAPPLHFLRSGVNGGNGVYTYGAGNAFPTATFNATNYWVDVVFTSGASDTTPPTVSATSPANGATGVSVGTVVTATFSEAMDAATISGTTFALRDAAGQLVAATVSYNASTRTATLAPSTALTPGASYTATVIGGANDPRVKDVAGNALAASVSWAFSTNAAGDTTPPTITTTTPANGATGVTGTATVSATFSEAMDASTINGTTFTLRTSGGALVAATVAYNVATFAATLTPGSALAANTTYTATVAGGAADPRVKDAAGNALAASTSWSFTTGDTTPPTVTTTSPANGATGVSGTANVTATFSEPMTATTINTGTFLLRDAANNFVTATVSYNATSRVATLNPSPTLLAGATYTATVVGGASGVKDSAGNALAVDKVWSFTILADTTAPTVTAMSPADGTTGVSGTANVTATFSEAMAATTINTGTFVLLDSSNNLVSATVNYNATSRVATLNPAPTLLAGARYTATVVGGASGVKDSAGNALAVDKVWSFTILTDTTPPTITSISPASGATGVSRTANVTATFSEAVDPASVNGSTFVLVNAATGTAVSATLAISSNGRTVTLNPVATLPSLTQFTARVVGGPAGIKDLVGNALVADRVWSFTTR
jgi:hypothetical protein